MLDCFVPNWVWLIFDWIDGRELTITLGWLLDKGIISCNEVI